MNNEHPASGAWLAGCDDQTSATKKRKDLAKLGRRVITLNSPRLWVI